MPTLPDLFPFGVHLVRSYPKLYMKSEACFRWTTLHFEALKVILLVFFQSHLYKLRKEGILGLNYEGSHLDTLWPKNVKLTPTLKIRLFGRELSQSINGDLISNSLSLFMRHMWLALPKIFAKPRYVISLVSLQPRMLVHLSNTVGGLSVGQWLFLKPCHWSEMTFM